VSRAVAAPEVTAREVTVQEVTVQEVTVRIADPSALLAALGGRRNVGDVECHAGRVLVRIADPKIVDERALRTLGIRGVARPTAGSMQLLIPGSAEDWAQPLRQLLA
jgi:phosphotransferase system IIB component